MAVTPTLRVYFVSSWLTFDVAWTFFSHVHVGEIPVLLSTSGRGQYSSPLLTVSPRVPRRARSFSTLSRLPNSNNSPRVSSSNSSNRGSRSSSSLSLCSSQRPCNSRCSHSSSPSSNSRSSSNLSSSRRSSNKPLRAQQLPPRRRCTAG